MAATGTGSAAAVLAATILYSLPRKHRAAPAPPGERGRVPRARARRPAGAHVTAGG